MAKGPWAVTGPWVPSQTPAALRKRYLMSFVVLGALLLPIVGVIAYLGDRPWRLIEDVFALSNKAAALAGFQIPAWHLDVIATVLPFVFVIALMQVAPIFLVWWEMKIAAHIQIRMGPMWVGRFHGALQTIADGIKLLLKEDIVPKDADRKLHFWAPIVAVAPAYVCFAPIPFGKSGFAPINLDVGLLFVLGISGLSVIGLLMAGWGSNSKFSVLGGLRAAAQMVSYEIPRVIALVPVVMWAGTLSLGGIMDAQSGLWNGFLPRWFIFYPVVGQIAFIIYLISSIAETNRTPFDLAEAESELTSGFHTEYSGMKWAMFFMAEYAYMFLACALGAVLFLGGGAPIHPSLSFIPSYAWFFLKVFGLVFLFIWIRWTYPRMRVDRLMEFCWKFLLPWALVNVALAGFIFLMRS